MRQLLTVLIAYLLFLIACSEQADETTNQAHLEVPEAETIVLGAPNVHCKISGVIDRTNLFQVEGVQPVSVEMNRLRLQWLNLEKADTFGYLTNAKDGDTLKVLFEGAARYGIASISFNLDALPESQRYHWTLSDKNTGDTIQFAEFSY